jgi:hypothetical protein
MPTLPGSLAFHRAGALPSMPAGTQRPASAPGQTGLSRRIPRGTSSIPKPISGVLRESLVAQEAYLCYVSLKSYSRPNL